MIKGWLVTYHNLWEGYNKTCGWMLVEHLVNVSQLCTSLENCKVWFLPISTLSCLIVWPNSSLLIFLAIILCYQMLLIILFMSQLCLQVTSWVCIWVTSDIHTLPSTFVSIWVKFVLFSFPLPPSLSFPCFLSFLMCVLWPFRDSIRPVSLLPLSRQPSTVEFDSCSCFKLYRRRGLSWWMEVIGIDSFPPPFKVVFWFFVTLSWLDPILRWGFLPNTVEFDNLLL